MSNEIVRSEKGAEIAVSETLEQLAQRANVAHMRAVETAQDAVQHAIAAGQALLEAKKRCRPGTWYVWVTEHFRGSIRTAQGYMRLAVHAPQINYDAHGRAHLNYEQLRCMMKGLAATDGRAKSARKTRAELEATVPPSKPAIDRCCGDPTCLPIVSVSADYDSVAESLLETLTELAALADSQSDGGYALHLFERLRMIYLGLGQQQWFHEWQINMNRS